MVVADSVGDAVDLKLTLTPWRWRLTGLLFLTVMGLLYAPTLVDLVSDWWRNPDYSHGFLIPFAALYFLWRKQRILRSAPSAPTNLGLLVILASQAVFLLGYLGAEYFLQRFSLVLLLAGLVLYLWGWRHLSETSFVLVLLLLAIPLPTRIFNAVALPLQLVASSWAESLLRLCHVPVFRDGNILQLDQQMLNVTEACSGIRSLASLITAGVIVAYFLPVRAWVRAFFVASSIPIALAANALRVAGTGLIGQAFGERWATGFMHLFSGWVIFVLAFCLLCAEWMLLQRWFEPHLLPGESHS